MTECLTSRCADLSRAMERLKLISAHDALMLLRNSLSAPKLLYTLRAACCVDHHQLTVFDDHLSSICNVSLTDDQWLQASLPVRNGGLGLSVVLCCVVISMCFVAVNMCVTCSFLRLVYIYFDTLIRFLFCVEVIWKTDNNHRQHVSLYL